MSNDTSDKLPFNDERYLIPGTNFFNLSKWTRENTEWRVIVSYEIDRSVVE